MNDQQTAQNLRNLCEAIIETVKAAGPNGEPAGPLYAALSSVGCSLSDFREIISALCIAGKLRQSGNLLFAA